MTYYLYILGFSEFPLALTPMHSWARAYKAVSWARKHEHDIRMVVISDAGSVVRDHTYTWD